MVQRLSQPLALARPSSERFRDLKAKNIYIYITFEFFFSGDQVTAEFEISLELWEIFIFKI